MSVDPVSPLSTHDGRPGRRSFPNLTHLSLAPLSSRIPIDDDGYEEHEDEYLQPTTSYIQGKSAPTTPGILSKPRQHRRRKSKKTAYAHESYFPPSSSYDTPLVKARSAGAIHGHHTSLTLTPMSVAPHGHHRDTSEADGDDEWVRRAGLLLSNEAREFKGQSWLARRESSTSLVQPGEELDERLQREQDEAESIVSEYQSRRGSAVHSRVPSARPSRRGSRAGSRLELFTPLNRGMESREVEGYFDELAVVEPDFVDKDDDAAMEAEAEIRRLANLKGFGIGGLVDKLLGFPLFNVEEPSDEEAEAEEQSPEELRRRKEEQMKRRREQLARTATSSAVAASRAPVVEPQQPDGEGGWKDAAWLLSVASKVVL